MRIDRPVRKGQIWWVAWEPHRGSEQAGRRPSVVIQADFANALDEYGNTIVAAMSTSGMIGVPSHIPVDPSPMNGLSSPGFVKCEQIVTISKSRLDGYIGKLEPRHIRLVDEAIKVMLDLD